MTETPARPAPLFADIDDVARRLAETGYLPDTATATAVFLADRLGKPLLVEGPAGVGKTELARAVAQCTGSGLVRLQCYEGVDEARALYEWNHAKQILRIQSGNAAGQGDWDQTKMDVFSEEFLLSRPLLTAIRRTEPTVLLIDETDKADIEIEGLLLEVLTPIAKSWPSEWCLEANSLAIQVHGGYGYTRDFPVEQYWRDNRLNMIHEGSHGIQALDLLGRKVIMNGGAGLKAVAARMQRSIDAALPVPAGPLPELHEYAAALASALSRVGAATQAAWATGEPVEALAV